MNERMRATMQTERELSSLDPDADRPCSCEESERLRARVAELEAERDRLISDIGAINNDWHAETMRKLAAESEARALRIESDARLGMIDRQVDTIRALREKIERAIGILDHGYNSYHSIGEALEVLRAE